MPWLAIFTGKPKLCVLQEYKKYHAQVDVLCCEHWGFNSVGLIMHSIIRSILIGKCSLITIATLIVVRSGFLNWRTRLTKENGSKSIVSSLRVSNTIWRACGDNSSGYVAYDLPITCVDALFHVAYANSMLAMCVTGQISVLYSWLLLILFVGWISDKDFEQEWRRSQSFRTLYSYRTSPGESNLGGWHV